VDRALNVVGKVPIEVISGETILSVVPGLSMVGGIVAGSGTGLKLII